MNFLAKNAISSQLDGIKNSLGLSETSDENKKESYINWNDHNYPPLIRKMHFDHAGDPMPAVAKTITKVAYFTYRATILVLIINFWTTLIFGVSGAKPALDILFAILTCIALSTSSTFSFYNCYKGVAGDMKIYRTRYCIIQVILTILMIVFSLVNSGNLHGWTAIGSANNMTGFFDFVCVLESGIWVFAIICGSYSIYQTYLYFGHGEWNPDMSKSHKGKKKEKREKKDKKSQNKSTSSSSKSDIEKNEPTSNIESSEGGTKKSFMSIFK